MSRTDESRRCRWLALLVIVMLGGRAVAQDLKYPTPEMIERVTRTDEAGKQQWAEYTAPKCPTCTGTGKTKCVTCARFPADSKDCPECHRKDNNTAVCRVCAGTGSIPDPLLKVVCPGCLGAGFLECLICGGGGQLKVNGAKQWSACPGCRGEGGYPCTTCKGERVVEAVPLKPSLAEAPADKLKKALATADEGLKQLAAFTPGGGPRARKESKQLEDTLDALKALHPAFKTLPKSTKDYMGKTFAGAQFQGHEEVEANAMNYVKRNAEYFLKHQKRMMELALKRAEANAQVAGK